MRQIAPALQAYLDDELTNFCYLWAIQLRHGASIYLTDHHESLMVGGAL